MARGAIIMTVGTVAAFGIVACTPSTPQPQAKQATATVLSPPPGCATSSCLVGDDPVIYVASAESPGGTVPIKGRLRWLADEACLLLDITSSPDASVAIPLWPSGTAPTRTANERRGVVVPGVGQLLAGEGFAGQGTWHRADVGFLPPPSRCRHHDGYLILTEVKRL